jgi:hypothetical protein
VRFWIISEEGEEGAFQSLGKDGSMRKRKFAFKFLARLLNFE